MSSFQHAVERGFVRRFAGRTEHMTGLIERTGTCGRGQSVTALDRG
jgi:hypothetical protein